MDDTMRDLLSKLDAIVSETALNPNDPKGDYAAKKKALDDLERDGETDKAAIQQRRLDLDKEAESKGVRESTIFEIGDSFGISFSEDHEIATEIVGFVEDGIVIELDDTALGMLESQGVLFLEGELAESLGEDKGPCWTGYKQVGMKKKGSKMVPNCVKENNDIEESGLQYYTGKKKYGKDGMTALAKAGREGASEEELGRIKDKFKKEDHGPEDPKADYNQGEYDREGDMAKDQLRTIDSAAEELYSIIAADENLPEWVQKKITLAMDYIDTARDYMKSNKYAEAEEKSSSGGTIKRTDTGLKHYAKYDDDDKDDYDDDKLDKARIRRIEKATKPDDIDEAKYQGKEVPLGKKLPGDVKKSKVYVRKPNGKVVKVNFGDKKMRIKKSNPARRKSFRARHNCKNPGPRWKARYWSCRSW
jgi:hypothetical protein